MPTEPDVEHPDDQGVDPGIVAIDHVGLAVADLDAAVAFHTEVLGLRLVHSETNAEQGVAEAMMTAGPADSGRAARTQVQLLAPIDEAVRWPGS